MRIIGIFGGTFNPVHLGHLRTALEIKKALAMDTMLLVPCGIPPHRDEPDIDPEIRLAMLNAAIVHYDELLVDDRELQRAGPSYMVDTLQSIRDEEGDVSLCLCVGADAFIHLDTWHHWTNLIGLAHIIVAFRPGWPVETLQQQVSDDLKRMLKRHMVTNSEQLHEKPAGYVLTQKVTDIDISSSMIRQRIARGQSVKDYVPASVLQIIRSKQLYQNIERS
ncbi:nicotinate-nucleotide adenylyltransferase [Kaarinaea lacus]